MNLTIKRTHELSDSDKKEICSLFEKVFQKNMSLSTFENKFSSQDKTFSSYHALMYNDDHKIVGCYSAIPYEYFFFGSTYLFALSVDTMIDEKYRGNPFTLKKLAELAYAALEKNGVSFVFGFPNDNVYLIRKKILKWKDIGELDFYILPIQIGALMPKFRLLNLFSRLFATCVQSISGRFALSTHSENKPIHIDKNESFILRRYDSSYKIIHLTDTVYFSYKIYNEDAVISAYIIDVFPLNKINLELAVKSIYRQEKGLDVIMYIGSLNFSPINLIKVPKKAQPKKVRMAGKILNSSSINEDIFDIGNWNVNLSNYDVR